MSKEVKIKDVSEEQIDEKKIKRKKIRLIVLILLVSLVGLLFFSTYVRWKADIEDKNKLIYYKQDGIKIDSLVDFYGSDVDIDIDDNEAILMYCNKDYGKNCMTADYNNLMENIYRDPVIIINVVIIIDLILFYMLIKDKFMKDYKKVIMGLVILLYGLSLTFVQVYKIADYYIFANNNFKTTATIYKKVLTSNEKSFFPIVKYEIDGKEYINYLDTKIKGNIEDKVGEEIEIHYYKKDKNEIVNKKNVLWRIAPALLGTVICLESIWFFPKMRKIEEDKKDNKKEEAKEKGKS